MSQLTVSGIIPGLRAAQTAVGESEPAIANNIAANWPEYNGQPLSEALDRWNQIILRASQGRLEFDPLIINNRTWRTPWRNFERFGPEKRDRIVSMVNESITRRVGLYSRGYVPKRETWHYTETDRYRIVEVPRDERGRFVGGTIYLVDVTNGEFF